MNAHLTEHQISEALIGDVSEPSRRHLLNCEACRSQLSRFQNELALFGQAVRNWTEAVAEEPVRVKPARTATRAWPLPRFAMAGLVTAMLLAGFAWVGTRPTRTIPSAAAPVTDAALLSQVDLELARTVPASMEPLTKLVTVDQATAAAQAEETKQ